MRGLAQELNITLLKLRKLSRILSDDDRLLRKIAMGFNMTVSELLDFPEMNEMEFEDE